MPRKQDLALESLSHVVKTRRQELGLSQAEVEGRGGPGEATVRRLERGEAGKPRERTRRDLERALEWAPGSVDEVLAGGEPTDVADGLANDREDREALDWALFRESEGETSADDRALLKEHRNQLARQAVERRSEIPGRRSNARVFVDREGVIWRRRGLLGREADAVGSLPAALRPLLAAVETIEDPELQGRALLSLPAGLYGGVANELAVAQGHIMEAISVIAGAIVDEVDAARARGEKPEPFEIRGMPETGEKGEPGRLRISGTDFAAFERADADDIPDVEGLSGDPWPDSSHGSQVS